MRILLIQPPSQEMYQAFLPLGLAYVAGSLLEAGHDVAVWDINAEKWTRDEVAARIESQAGGFDLAGLTGLSGDYAYIEWTIRCLKESFPELKVILGGVMASALPGFVMSRMPLDYVAVGEGERTMVELAGALERGLDPSQIHGLYIRGPADEIIAAPPRPRLRNLDELPLPPWELFPMQRYMENQHPGFQYGWDEDGSGVISIMATRGCPYGCLYCDHTVKGFDLRYRPVSQVLDEIRRLKENYGERIKTFYFWDDILIWDREWMVDFCRRLIHDNLGIQWTCNGHVNKVDARLMKMMKEAGCVNVRFGIESGSQRMLDTLKKGVKVERALESLRICTNAGLSLTLYIMVGVPGENQETVEETISFFEKLIGPTTVRRIKRVHFFLLTPYPGTRLFDEARKKGLIPDLAEFLYRGCDAYSNIPLNMSGQSDGEILRLKNSLQETVGGMLQSEYNRLLNILMEMKGRAAVGVSPS